MSARFVRLRGQTPYAEAHALQQALLRARIDGHIPDTVLLLEHAPVITVGRARGAEANVLDAAGVPVIRVERGGDVTWHGPGQLVAYPIVALEGDRRDLHRHLHALEDAVLGLLADLGLAAGRDARNTGVWLPTEPAPTKVCSIGIACRRWVTWHGLALNIDNDPNVYRRINPCGFDASTMTRLADHLDAITLAGCVGPLADHLAEQLGLPAPGVIETRTTAELHAELR